MLKDAGINEGHWNLTVNFRLGAGGFGPSPDEVLPSGFVGVESIGIQKIEPKAGAPLLPLCFNAAELNPKP